MLKTNEENNSNKLSIKSNYSSACLDIANSILQFSKGKDTLTKKDILKLVRKKSSDYNLDTIPKYADILNFLPPNNYYRQILRVKPIRTSSGVAVITVMPMPFECPHGKCIYCPGGIEMNTPLSYVGTEPSTKTAQKVGYDPFKQITAKLNQLKELGHTIDKAEIVIVGGTFPFYPKYYQIDFVKKCFDALNSFETKKIYENIQNNKESNDNLLFLRNSVIEDLKSKNQNAQIRCVGLTIETKPDYCKRQHVDFMLDLGATRIEIGIQALNNEVYKVVNRGHNLEDVYESFYASRNSGFKIVAHMMPGLPQSSPSQDINDCKKLFEDERLKPDMLKIYPTLVLKGTGLFKLYSEGKYKGYMTEDIVKILIQIKRNIPPWTRIMRIQREIEPKDIIDGPNLGNIRQLVLKELKKQGFKCKCIRCREVGLVNLNKEYAYDDILLHRIDYYASKGKEIFLSFESQDKSLIFGFLRLRIITDPQRRELYDSLKLRPPNKDLIYDNHLNDTYKCAIIRELHIYGPVVEIHNKLSFEKKCNKNIINKNPENDFYYQHKGFGKRLIDEAERICNAEYNLNELSILSAVGTRDYYKKFGYTINGPYVTKKLL